jgi:hypothetical protein
MKGPRRIGLALAATVTLLAPADAAAARPPLMEVDYVTSRLVAARIAYRIYRTCPKIGGRLFYAIGEAKALKRWALGKGYSETEIETFVENKANKKVIYGRADAYLKKNGATDERGHCALGQAEIANKSYIGTFIFEK